MKERTGFIMMAVGLVIVALSMAFGVNAHTMNVTECHTFAWDVKQAAADRDKATFKMQDAVFAASLEICHDAAHRMACIYKDDADTAQAENALGWVYANPKLTPQQIHDKVESDCNEHLMDSLTNAHTYGHTDMR